MDGSALGLLILLLFSLSFLLSVSLWLFFFCIYRIVSPIYYFSSGDFKILQRIQNQNSVVIFFLVKF